MRHQISRRRKLMWYLRNALTSWVERVHLRSFGGYTCRGNRNRSELQSNRDCWIKGSKAYQSVERWTSQTLEGCRISNAMKFDQPQDRERMRETLYLISILLVLSDRQLIVSLLEEATKNNSINQNRMAMNLRVGFS